MAIGLASTLDLDERSRLGHRADRSLKQGGTLGLRLRYVGSIATSVAVAL
jgi:hypothetical protein